MDLFSYYFGYPYVIVGIMGTFSNAIVLISNLLLVSTPSTALLLYLSFADMILCLSISIFTTGYLVYGYYPWSFPVCVTHYYLVLFACGSNILTVASIAVERYLATNHFIFISWPTAYSWIGIVFVISVFIPAIPFFIEPTMQFIELEESYWLCLAKWYSVETAPQAILWTCLTIMFLSFCVISFCYFKVYSAYKNCNNEKKKKNNKNQRRILIRCFVITAVFLALWSLELLKLIVNVITRQPTSSILAASVVNSALNPVLMIVLDNRVKSHLYRFLNLKTEDFTSKSNTKDSRSEDPYSGKPSNEIQSTHTRAITATVLLN